MSFDIIYSVDYTGTAIATVSIIDAELNKYEIAVPLVGDVASALSSVSYLVAKLNNAPLEG